MWWQTAAGCQTIRGGSSKEECPHLFSDHSYSSSSLYDTALCSRWALVTPSRSRPIVCYNSSISQIRHQPPKPSILLLLSVLQSLLVLPVRLNPPSGSLRIPLTVFIVSLWVYSEWPWTDFTPGLPGRWWTIWPKSNSQSVWSPCTTSSTHEMNNKGW